MGIKEMMKKRKQKAAEQKEYEQAMDGLAKVLALDPNGTFHFPESEDEETVEWSIGVNLTEKAVKAIVPEETGLNLKDVDLKEEDGHIIAEKNGRVVFDVTKRSKAYKELEEVTGHRAKSMYIYGREGDYGLYYRTKLYFLVVPDEWSQHG